MVIRFDKQTVKKDLIEKYAKNLGGIIEEDNMFYSIILPFNSNSNCECSHFTECKNLSNCRKKLSYKSLKE